MKGTYIYVSDVEVAHKYETFIRGFIDEHSSSFQISQKRDCCHKIAYEFKNFMTQLSAQLPTIKPIANVEKGAFKIDKPIYKVEDFTVDELVRMKSELHDPHDVENRIKFAIENELDTIIIKPDWSKYGKSAGLIRNTDIIKSSDLIIAFWDGESKGTLDSINKSEKFKKPIIVIKFKEE